MRNARSVGSIYRSIETIGNALNNRAAAAALKSRLQARARQVTAERTSKVHPTVSFPIWSDPLIAAGKRAFVTELITMAGGDSVTADVAEDWTQMSIESVVNEQPQLLILPGSWQTTIEVLARQAGWRDRACVRHNQMIRVDDRIELPSSVAFDVLENLPTQFDRWDAHGSVRLGK